VKVSPGARRTGVEGVTQLAAEETALKVSLTAPPSEGQANRALVQFLAKTFGLAKRDVEILRGAGSRQKLLLLRGDSEGLARQVKSLY